MSDILAPERLKAPLKDDSGYFYPITSYNQILMPDGTFWNGEANETGAIFVDRSGATAGVPAPIDADTLKGLSADKYALKTDLNNIPSDIPAGGLPGQVLSKVSVKDQDVCWSDNSSIPKGGQTGQALVKSSNADDAVQWKDIDWESVKSKPEQYSPTSHEHQTKELSDAAIEEWTFVLTDGSTVKRKVLMLNA